MTTEVFVEIFHVATDKVERRMGPMSMSKAQRVAAGAYINMGDDYSVRIVDTDHPKRAEQS